MLPKPDQPRHSLKCRLGFSSSAEGGVQRRGSPLIQIPLVPLPHFEGQGAVFTFSQGPVRSGPAFDVLKENCWESKKETVLLSLPKN